jgi:hypothetical protein
MPFESCPVCGYALSVADHRCRHCPAPLRVFQASRPFNVKQLSTIIVVALALSFLTYVIFFR